MGYCGNELDHLLHTKDIEEFVRTKRTAFRPERTQDELKKYARNSILLENKLEIATRGPLAGRPGSQGRGGLLRAER